MRSYIQNSKGHLWKKNESGSVDIFGLEADPHNGPLCVQCGYAFCHHCDHEPKYTCAEWEAKVVVHKESKRRRKVNEHERVSERATAHRRRP